MPRNSCLFKRYWLRHCFLLACYMLLALHSSAQTPSYLHYDICDGLPSNLVYCAYQDKKGIMWFGTNNGLASFDGIRFHVYGTKDGLLDPEILGLWEDNKNRLWIANFWRPPSILFGGEIYTEATDTFLQKLPQNCTAFTFFEESNNQIRFGGLRKNSLIVNENHIRYDTFETVIARFAKINNSLYACGSDRLIKVEETCLTTLFHCMKPGESTLSHLNFQ